MLSRAQSKYIRSLALQKFRKEHGVYVIEGEKLVLEILKGRHDFQLLVATDSFFEKYESLTATISDTKKVAVTADELTVISSLQTASQALIILPLPQFTLPQKVNNWTLVLDDIRDPGNMGTLLRIADWFGITHVIASQESVDFYNPKVVQAAMGAHLRVQLHTTDLPHWIPLQQVPVYATVLDGKNIFAKSSYQPGLILIGNESKGLHENLKSLATHQLYIPGKGSAESLNASVAAGIVCAVLIEGQG